MIGKQKRTGLSQPRQRSWLWFIAIAVLLLVVPCVVSATTVKFNPATDTADGRVYYIGAVHDYYTIRNAGSASTGLITTSSYAKLLGDALTNNYSSMYRGAILFPTASLPNRATVTSATLSLYAKTRYNGLLVGGMGITGFTLTNTNGTLAAADYSGFLSTRYADTDKVFYATWNTDTWANYTLNAAGRSAINVSGYTPIMVRLACDIDNTTPTWATDSSYGEYSDTNAGTNVPELTVTYTAPPTASFTTNRAGVVRIPRTVTFTDTSTEVPTSWLWDFGDGSG